MPLQNRVTPMGDLIAHPSRAAIFMGNRGCLHDADRRIVRRSSRLGWVCCVLNDPKGRRRTVMQSGHYTELFFLDEATALAAGHRPCNACRREDTKRFFATWALVHPDWAAVSAPAVDAHLHTERTQRSQLPTADVQALPRGCIVRSRWSDAFFLVQRRGLLPWSFEGYGEPIAPSATHDDLALVTPPSIVKLLAAGYPVQLHPSAGD